MCNLYSMTKSVDAIRQLFGAINSQVGNLPSLPGIFPNHELKPPEWSWNDAGGLDL